MNRLISFLLISFLMACQTKPAKQTALSYPDIKGYFKKEVERLQKQKPIIEKTIHLNKENETKLISAINWEEELSLFAESDINKATFKGLYRINRADKELVYTALADQLKTREIRILYTPKGQIGRIAITNHTENSLYTSDEFLEYLPDSVYQIVKRQEVQVLGTNNYWVLGKFKK